MDMKMKKIMVEEEEEEEEEEEDKENYLPPGARDWLRKEAKLEVQQKDFVELERKLLVAEATTELLGYTARFFGELRSFPPRPEIFEWCFAALDVLKSLRADEDCDGYKRRRPRMCGSEPVPRFFVCPISKKMMTEPVVIASGKTFERSVIKKWFDEGNYMCPLTGQVLPNTILIPDVQIAKLIFSWRSLYKCKREQENDDEVLIELHDRAHSHFYGLVYLITSDAGSKRAEAIKDFLFLITWHRQSVNRLVNRNPEFIILLFYLLFESRGKADSELQNSILGILCIVAEHLPSKKIITAIWEAILILIITLREGLSMEVKTKCAIIFSLLSDDVHTNKVKIGELGGMGLLVALLKEGNTEAKRAAASAILKLCEARENWGRAFLERAVIAALHAMYCDDPVEEAMPILRALAGCGLILSEMMTETAWLLESVGAERFGNQGRQIIELMDSKVVRACDDCGISCSPDIARVLRWLKRRSDFPRTLGYESE